MLYIGCGEGSVDNTMIFNILLNSAYILPRSSSVSHSSQPAGRMRTCKELRGDTARPPESKCPNVLCHNSHTEWEMGEHLFADGN